MPADTQTNSFLVTVAKLGRSPWFLALVVTLANAVKPVLVDDTAYITYARHISQHPLDPYGFEMFWWTTPCPAMEVLVPPVLPYWLAINISLFGEHPWLLKLSLYPFLFALAWSLRELLHRFARGTESRFLPLLMLSPSVLPTVNLMLDIPAIALGLAAVTVFLRAADRRSFVLAIAAGLLAALAMQTKYTALLIPPVIGWYGLTHRRVRLAVVAAGVAGLGFVAWEALLVAKYNESHFQHHAKARGTSTDPQESRLAVFFREKSNLAPPLAGQLGCLASGISLAIAASLGVPRQTLLAAAILWVAACQAIVLLPASQLGRLTPTFWQTSGWLYLFGLVLCGQLLLRNRRNPDTAFVVGWALIELVGYFALTPFGAARRVISLTLVGGLLVARVVRRVERLSPDRRPPSWVFGFGIAAGVAVAALDTFDAFPEKVCAERSAAMIPPHPPTATVWFAGHWGFQYYCERAGMRPLVPGSTTLQPGDYLVLPRFPNEEGFFRPHCGEVSILPPEWAIEPIADVIWDDAISGQTIPNFYGGVNPIAGRDDPRLRVGVYRIRRAWLVPGE